MTTDQEFESEQAYILGAYERLDAMRVRAEALVGLSEDPDLEVALQRRVRLLTDNGRPLCFGRIDHDGGPNWYVGRRHVEDDAGDPVVVEWRTPVAVPFYRAGLADPMGLERRRQFVVDRSTLLSMADDLFGPDAAAAGDARVRGRDALLAELERQRSGVLVIGPNRTFLRYIALVLPSLGEEAVVQTTLPDLVPEIRVRAADPPELARLKGDRRMAEVLRRALDQCRRPAEADLELAYGVTRMRVTAEEMTGLVDRLAERRAPYNAGRSALRERLAGLAYRAYAEGVGRMKAVEPRAASRDIQADPAFRAMVDRLWPAIAPAALVRDLLGSPGRMRRAADAVLSAHEQGMLLSSRRATPQIWTDGDAALVDEARELLSGRTRRYGHVVVDEAQDLSPMQVRMLARRAPGGSVTVLGDLAQGTGVWAHDTWDEVVDLLPAPRGRRSAELTLGYRAPGRVLDLASRLLPLAAASVRPTESIRPGRTEPRVSRVVGPEELIPAAVEEARRCTEFGSVGLIVATADHGGARVALAGSDLDWSDASAGQLGRDIALIPAPTAKGLEFDAVVVVEPAAIVEDAPRGLRLLYVAMTRPTKHLSMVHHRPLPEPLDA